MDNIEEDDVQQPNLVSLPEKSSEIEIKKESIAAITHCEMVFDNKAMSVMS